MYNLKIFIVLGMVLFMPFSAKACNVKLHAKSYINKINFVLGGERPKLVIEKGSNDEVAAFYDGNAIHIYKGDYKGSCYEVTPYLKSVIAHEYAHHAESKLRPFTKLRGEKLAYVAEHAIGDVIFGDNIEYDNDEDLKHPTTYNSLKDMLKNKQIIRGATASRHVIYFKNRR